MESAFRGNFRSHCSFVKELATSTMHQPTEQTPEGKSQVASQKTKKEEPRQECKAKPKLPNVGMYSRDDTIEGIPVLRERGEIPRLNFNQNALCTGVSK